MLCRRSSPALGPGIGGTSSDSEIRRNIEHRAKTFVELCHARKRKKFGAKKTSKQGHRSTKFAQDLSGHICRVGVRIKGDQVMIAGKHSNAKYLPLTSSCALGLAYTKQSARAVAAAFNCSPPTVATARRAVAACYMALQRHRFDKLATAFSQVPAPAWRVSFNMSNSTRRWSAQSFDFTASSETTAAEELARPRPEASLDLRRAL